MKKHQIILLVATLALPGLANAQGTLDVAETGTNSAYTSSSITMDVSNIITGTSGIFSSTVPDLSQLTASNITITGLSASPIAEVVSNFFVFSTPDTLQSSSTTPPNRFEFDLMTLAEPTDGDFTGTGILVDTTAVYVNTAATFNLTFSGLDNYSFVLTEVPEPTTVSLVGVGLLGAWAFRRRKT